MKYTLIFFEYYQNYKTERFRHVILNEDETFMNLLIRYNLFYGDVRDIFSGHLVPIEWEHP